MIKNHIPGIYKILNKVNGKVYIGQSKSVTIRWRKHRYNLKNNIHGNSYLQEDYNEYGEENFEYLILEHCNTNEVGGERETYWIEQYKSLDPKFGYNCQSGGRKGTKLNDVTKLKMSKAAKKRGIPEETLKKAWESTRNRTKENHHFYGKEFSKEHKEKLSLAKIGRTNKPHTEETKRKIGEANKISKLGSKHSMESKRKMSENSKVKIPITDEMIQDVKCGLSRRNFQQKYGHVGVWTRIRDSLI